MLKLGLKQHKTRVNICTMYIVQYMYLYLNIINKGTNVAFMQTEYLTGYG